MNIVEFCKSLFGHKCCGGKCQKSMNPNIGTNFDFILDDPAIADLKENVVIPNLPNPCPVFTLQGNVDRQSMQVYSTLVFSLSFVQPNLLHPLNRWSSTNNLRVYPRAGEDFNAYYDRANLKFFYNKDNTGSMVYTCDSPDIVAHELGHAILDAIRPDLWNVQCLETAAFHEAFGDTMAILSALQHPSVVNMALSQTNNDISKSNVISRLAEQMGIAINRLTGGRAGLTDALRNAVNNFMYVIPETLPANASSDAQLIGECHSFSRVFAGAWYDCLVGMYNLEIASGLKPYDALIKVRDLMSKIYLQALPLANLTVRFYAAVANAMMVSARNINPAYENVIRVAMTNRKIITPQVKMMEVKKFADIVIGNEDHVWKFNHSTVVRKKQAAKFTIPAKHGIVALSAGLENVEIEVAQESYMEFDKHGNMVAEMSTNFDDVVSHAMFVVNKLVADNDIEFVAKVDYDKKHTKTHAVVGGKLQRIYFN